jgi:hypothetical protein
MLPQKFSAATTRNFPLVPRVPPDGAADPPRAAAFEAVAREEDELELPHAPSTTATTRLGTSSRSNRTGTTQFL